MKHKVFKLIEKGGHGSRINAKFDYTIITLIILNVIAEIIETIPNISESLILFLKNFEIFSVIIFSIEYLLRIYASSITYPSSNKFKSALKYIFSFYGLIDLLAIMPFYLPYLIPMDLRFLRILRLMRVFRILKLNRYNTSLNLIWKVIKEKRAELTITGFATILILFIASFLMYYIEGDAQPDKFPDILSSFWWAIVTLTTIGYGDVVPITGFGKIISGLFGVLGIGLIILPTGIISAGFIEKIKKPDKNSGTCPHCGKEIEK